MQQRYSSVYGLIVEGHIAEDSSAKLPEPSQFMNRNNGTHIL